MKKFLNALLYLFILWFLLISESQNIKVIIYSLVAFTIVMLARMNYRSLIQFFHEKETLK